MIVSMEILQLYDIFEFLLSLVMIERMLEFILKEVDGYF